MNRLLFLTTIVIFITIFFTGILGCSEDEESEEEFASIVEIEPGDGGEMFSNGDLIITFDRPVSWVWINRIPADVNGSKAVWRGQGLEAGEQTLVIQWAVGSGSISSQEVSLTIREFSTIICQRAIRDYF